MLIGACICTRLWRTKDQRKRVRETRVAKFCFTVPFFADLVVIARSLYPIPSRTRPSKSSAPMVLSLKAWKSRSLPGLQRAEQTNLFDDETEKKPSRETAGAFCFVRCSSTNTLRCRNFSVEYRRDFSVFAIVRPRPAASGAANGSGIP
jgi:hypothetical protein